MADATMSDQVASVVRRAEELEASGELRQAIELLSAANRHEQDAELECALVRLRRAGGRVRVGPPASAPAPLETLPADGRLFEIGSRDLSVATVREGLARSGCVLVRGLVPPDRAARLAAGLDASLGAYDTATHGDGAADPAWYSPGPMPDREGSNMPEALHRAILRGRGALWTLDSPRMLFELFELVDDVGLGELMTELLGERPLMSGIKGTLRRVPTDIDVDGRWHQDGAFLGERIGALNIWIALTPCGRDAPGLEVVPKRIDHVVADPDAKFEWSLSEPAVLEAANGTPIARPEFEAGDAMIFDHLLVHRTSVAPAMTRQRYAIESWFFAPSAYPEGQLPVLY